MIKSKSSLKSVGWDFRKIQFSSSIVCLNKVQILHIVTEYTCPNYMNALCLWRALFSSLLIWSGSSSVCKCQWQCNYSELLNYMNMLKVFGWRVLYAKTFLQYMNNCYPFYYWKLSKISASSLFCIFCVLLHELCFSMSLNR